jgi:hypothetical protein
MNTLERQAHRQNVYQGESTAQLITLIWRSPSPGLTSGVRSLRVAIGTK